MERRTFLASLCVLAMPQVKALNLNSVEQVDPKERLMAAFADDMKITATFYGQEGRPVSPMMSYKGFTLSGSRAVARTDVERISLDFHWTADRVAFARGIILFDENVREIARVPFDNGGCTFATGCLLSCSVNVFQSRAGSQD